jgi:CubicO group peptidase (beta-lactamase class C family)
VRDLLAMRGGVYDFTHDAGFIVKTVYSNSEDGLLGFVIEKASGQTEQRYLSALISTVPDITHYAHPSW